MDVTLYLDEKLVEVVRKIAIERDTTLAGLVCSYLEDLAAEHDRSQREGRERDELEFSFSRFQFQCGKRTWKREDLHNRRRMPS